MYSVDTDSGDPIIAIWPLFMIDNETIRELVESAVAESFDEHLRTLHDDIVTRVMTTVNATMTEALASVEPPTPVVQEFSAADLNVAIMTIQSGSQQVEILKALLDGASSFGSRAALFILRGNLAVGWQARGFADNEAIKSVTVDALTGTFGQIVQGYLCTSAPLAEIGPKFGHGLVTEADGDCVLVPLVVRGKVAAVIYVDRVEDSAAVDIHTIELLSRAAGDWIELQALRKAAGAPAHYPVPTHSTESASAPLKHSEEVRNEHPAAAVAPPVPPLHQVSVATHAAAAPAPSRVPEPVVAAPVPVQAIPAVPEPVKTAPPSSTAVKGAPTDALRAESTVEDQELHKKARRFAKLLIDEIVLYNQQKVKEGREHRDLYDRLKDDIEKSRATYDKRYAQTPVAKSDYFTQALIAGLAAHNPALLGSNFPR